MSKRVALIGSGNAFFKDEGVGLYAAKYIKENYFFNQDELEIVDGGTLGFKLMPLLQEFDAVMIVNTASDESKRVGAISIKTTDEFLDGELVKKTANEVEIAEMLQICSMAERMAETIVISIVPEDIISVEVSLTENIRNVWDEYIQTIIVQLQKMGIEILKENEKLSLDAILDIFANPSIEHSRGF
ncbi:hydrogenase maturation protease [Sulfurimonas indica]|uniref:hydrogenase maturation protease n=1 Tax=Sulfurimonas indica TaxID=2508707 RepID=UPI0012656733|nr:hydrogenase maturation protease [Sulfurimonas indica]